MISLSSPPSPFLLLLHLFMGSRIIHHCSSFFILQDVSFDFGSPPRWGGNIGETN